MRFQTLKTVDIFRRGYGRRYSALPVDELDRRGLTIDCTEAYTQPQQYDLQIGDVVRWPEGDQGRYAEATIVKVQIEPKQVVVEFGGAELLPPDFFPF